MDNGVSPSGPGSQASPEAVPSSPEVSIPDAVWFASTVGQERQLAATMGWMTVYQAWGRSEEEALGHAVASMKPTEIVFLRTTWKVEGVYAAQGIETGTDETRSGSVSEADESPVGETDAPNPPSTPSSQQDRSDDN